MIDTVNSHWDNSKLVPHNQSEISSSSEGARRRHFAPRVIRHAFWRANLVPVQLNGTLKGRSRHARYKLPHELSLQARIRQNGGKSRRPIVNQAPMILPVCYKPSASRKGKRRIYPNGHGWERPMRKHKRLAVDNSQNAGGETRSQNTKDILRKKFRRLDSIERSGTFGPVHEDKGDGTQQQLTRGDGCKKKRANVMSVHTSSSFSKESPPEEEWEIGLRGCCRNESKRASVSELVDDWTQEYIQEPRKVERKRTIEELDLIQDEPILRWSRKDKRRPRIAVQEKCNGDRQGKGGASKASEGSKLNTDCKLEGGASHESLDLDVPNPERCTALAQENVGLLRVVGVSKHERSTTVTQGNVDVVHCDKLACTSQIFSGFEQVQEERHGPVTGDLVISRKIVGDSSRHVSHQEGISDPANVVLVPSIQNTIIVPEAASDDINVGSASGKMNFCVGMHTPGMYANHYCVEAMDQTAAVTHVSAATHAGKEIGQTSRGISYPAGFSEKEYAAVSEHEVELTLPEGRRCGLCGGGSDGEPPKYINSTKRAEVTLELEGLDVSCSDWDEFGNVPGWLGRLLGPLNDRFGIAGVWVHQECAIWSPEVYFAGVGRLKNVRAALRRGRLLKCSRCGQSGATIGCRVDRCQRTYHLPCARYEGSLFDHKKYLLACLEHLHLFLPRLCGNGHGRSGLAKTFRFKKLVGERKKVSKAALHRDLEAEEKWLENAGEDEEFARRERRRLHRHLARIVPVFVGGPDGENRNDNWESVAGLQVVVQCMKEMVILPLLYPEAFSNLGIIPPRGVLLHGDPGTGKTLAVRALVGACSKGDQRIAYFARKGADCLGKYAGDAERELRLLFQVAEQQQPSIVFFDEIDGLAPKRSEHQDQTQKSVVSTLLALMDGLNSRGSVIVIGATNRLDALDPALRRPGRFDREIRLPLPSCADRSSILALHTKNWGTPPSADVLSFLAQQTSGFAGADLQALCAQAAIIALKRVISLKDVLDVVEKEGVQKLSPLPSFTVKLSDWVAALKKVPLPCSRRMAKAAVNEVPSAPLPRHMVPALLWPLVELLVLLHQDPRVVLPPVLEKTAVLMEAVLESATKGGSSRSIIECLQLATKVASSGTCSSPLRASLFKGLEDTLIATGMVSSMETIQQDISDMNMQVPYSGSRFCIMLTGDLVNGLGALSAWILHGFEGFAEMRKLSLPTMLQEGGGDVILGLLNILGEVRNICPCVVFMPQIEIWAMEHLEDSKGEIRLISSQCWNLFMQQVNLLPANSSVIILASCGVSKNQLPMDIAKFFFGMESNVAKNLSSSGSHVFHEDAASGIKFVGEKETWSSCCNSTPCAWVQIEACPESKLVLDRAAQEYAKLLSSKFICAVYHTQRLLEPSDVCSEKLTRTESPVISPVFSELLCEDDLSRDCREPISEQFKGCKENGDSGKPSGIGQIDFFEQERQPLLQEQSQNSRPYNQSVDDGHVKSLTEGWSPQRKTLFIAVASCGYQLLYHPKLEELRHATFKLADGPFIHMRRNFRKASSGFRDGFTAPKEGEFGDGSSGKKERQDESRLRGLIAVGSLAYKGVYVRPNEVACGVHRVLELLNKRINLKVRQGKDILNFFRLQSQAAALEDHIFAWAYKLQSLEKAAKITNISFEPTGFGDRHSFGHSFDACAGDGLAVGELGDVPMHSAQICHSSMLHCSNPVDFDQFIDVKTTSEERKHGAGICLYSSYPPVLEAVGTPRASLSFKGLQGDCSVEVACHPATQQDSILALEEINKVEFKCSSRKMELGKKHKAETTRNMSLKPCFLAKSWNYCCECLQQVEHVLRDLFYESWRIEGSVNSLAAVSDVIGACTCAVSASIGRYDGSFVRVHNLKSHFQVAADSDTFSCICVKYHKPVMVLCSHVDRYSELAIGNNKKQFKDISQVWSDCERGGGDDLSSWLRTGFAVGKQNKISGNEVLFSEMSSVNRVNKLKERHDEVVICLCPLIQIISNLIPLVG